MDKTQQYHSKYSKSDRERLLYDIIYMWKQNKGRKVRQCTNIQLYKMNKFWKSNLQHGTTGNSTIHFKFAERVDLSIWPRKGNYELMS